MWVLLLIVAGLVTVVALLTSILALGDYLRARKAQAAVAAPASSIAADGPVVLRGRVVAEDDETLTSPLTGQVAVYMKLTVHELVGRRQRVALEEEHACPFLVDDGSGVLARVIVDGGRVVASRQETNEGTTLPPALERHVAEHGSFSWERTPRSCVAQIVTPGETVTVMGWVGKVRDAGGDEGVAVAHREGTAPLLAVAADTGAFGSPAGRAFFGGLGVALAGGVACLIAAWWGGLLG